MAELIIQNKKQQFSENDTVCQRKGANVLQDNRGQVSQARALTDNRTVQLEQNSPPKPNHTGLPNQLKSGIESLSGMSMDHVKVHYNSSQPAQLNAHAYAQGSDIHVASGQEKHLPHEAWHVVQQAQGRVKPTMQIAGKTNVNDDSQLETEADVMGAQALRAQHNMSDSIQSSRPLQSAASGSAVMQGAFGLEKESKVCVLQNGTPIDGYPTIGENKYFKVDIDKSKGNSILEVVTKHFNEHKGSAEEVLAYLQEQFSAAWGFIAAAQAVAADTPLKTIADAHDVVLHEGYQNLVVKPGGTLAGPIHFTVGFGLETIPELFPRLIALSASKKTAPANSARKRVGEAAVIGQLSGEIATNDEAGKGKINARKIDGFMQILYSQAGAVLDGAKDDDRGLIKNRTLALSRVSMGTIFSTLSPEEQRLVSNKEFYEAVISKMQGVYSGKKGKWGDHKKDATLFAPLVKSMLKAAFQVDGVKDNNPTDAFGKMTVVPRAEPVGDPTRPEPGFAMELRKIPVADESSFASIMTAASELILLSRGVHRTPEQLPPPKVELGKASPSSDGSAMRQILSAMNFKTRRDYVEEVSVELTVSSEADEAIRDIIKDSGKKGVDVTAVLAAFHAAAKLKNRAAILKVIIADLPPDCDRLAEEIVGYLEEML